MKPPHTEAEEQWCWHLTGQSFHLHGLLVDYLKSSIWTVLELRFCSRSWFLIHTLGSDPSASFLHSEYHRQKQIAHFCSCPHNAPNCKTFHKSDQSVCFYLFNTFLSHLSLTIMGAQSPAPFMVLSQFCAVKLACASVLCCRYLQHRNIMATIPYTSAHKGQHEKNSYSNQKKAGSEWGRRQQHPVFNKSPLDAKRSSQVQHKSDYFSLFLALSISFKGRLPLKLEVPYSYHC